MSRYDETVIKDHTSDVSIALKFVTKRFIDPGEPEKSFCLLAMTHRARAVVPA